MKPAAESKYRVFKYFSSARWSRSARILLCLPLILAMAVQSSGATIYRCKDDAGNDVYSASNNELVDCEIFIKDPDPLTRVLLDVEKKPAAVRGRRKNIVTSPPAPVPVRKAPAREEPAPVYRAAPNPRPVYAAERIQNARTFQQGNRVMVEYELTGDKPAEVRVSLKAKGESFSTDKLHLEGDFGKNVSPGRKRLVWNVLQDYPRGFSGEYVWDISAGGGGGSDPVTGMEFVEVPAGCFQMGDTFGGGDSDEKPVHEVCVSGFAIGKYEVTQGQWQRIMGSNPSYFSSCGDACPVEKVSWNDVQQFIQRLNSQTGGSFRLPTEAEWEFAARSGGKHEKYSGGDNVDAVAWYSGNSGSETHPVGQKQPNGLGIYDMNGNVWEWVQDWKGAYSAGRQQDPQGPSSGSHRVLRGGSWGSVPARVRASFRDSGTPDTRYNRLGFRLVSPVQ